MIRTVGKSKNREKKKNQFSQWFLKNARKSEEKKKKKTVDFPDSFLRNVGFKNMPVFLIVSLKTAGIKNRGFPGGF